MARFVNCLFMIVCSVVSLFSLYDTAPSVPVERPSSTICPKFMITCNDGQCIDRKKWCDRVEDCNDESDEEYCKTKGTFWSLNNPNHCDGNKHFKCKNFICVPLVNRCDGYSHCSDDSDEENCKKDSSEEDDSSEENGQGKESPMIEQEEPDQPNKPQTDSNDKTDDDRSNTPAIPNQEEPITQVDIPCPHTPTPCVQSRCQYDSTTCPHIQTLCSQLQMICSGTLSPWPCLNPCIQNSNPCPHVQAPCVQNGNPCPQVQPPCSQNINPCPHVQAPCEPKSNPCPQVQTPGVPNPPNTTPCPHVNQPGKPSSVPCPASTTPCPHVSRPGIPPSVPCPTSSTPCPHVSRPGISPSVPCPTSTTSCPHVSRPGKPTSVSHPTSTTPCPLTQFTTQSSTPLSSTTRSTTTQRQPPPTPKSRVSPIIQSITPPTQTITRSTKSILSTTPIQCPFTTTTKSPNPPTNPCPNSPSTKCPQPCPNGPSCENPCCNHNPNACPNACNPECNPCDPCCNPCPVTPSDPTPTPPCETPPGPCSYRTGKHFEFPESEYENFQFIYYDELEKAKKWLLETRNANYDWGTATPRGLVALSLLDQKLFSDFDSVDNGLMKRAFQAKLALEKDFGRENFKERQAQYMNAMLATNQNPRDFRGKDLVADLQEKVDKDLVDNKPINPFISLSICLAGLSDETRKFPYHAVEWLNPPSYEHKYQDMMSFAIMTLACYANDPDVKINYQKDIDEAVERLLERMDSDGSFGSKYSTALAAQALLSVKTHGNWDGRKTLDFLANHQVEDGSFGNLMATYYIVPALAGKSLVHLLNTACEDIEPTETDTPTIETTTTPIPRTRNMKIYIALHVGDTKELLSAVNLNMLTGANLLEVMQKASEINSDFRFRYDIINQRILIYSISGIPNDAERHHYWKLYIQQSIRSENKPITEEELYDKGGMEQIYLEDGNLIFFHYRKD